MDWSHSIPDDTLFVDFLITRSITVSDNMQPSRTLLYDIRWEWDMNTNSLTHAKNLKYV